MTQQEIDRKAEKIKALYTRYGEQIDQLRQKQTDIITRFIQELEKSKLGTVQDSLKSY